MPKICESDTIAAIATPMGEGGIGIVRLSGPASLSIAEKLFRKKAKVPWESHRLYYGHVVDPGTGQAIDEAMSVLMKAPKSYTREDVLEIHCHGGSIVTQTVLELVLREGARIAEPGEFTKRAFLNGRIDLTQAEAVIDLIRTKTPAGRSAAAEQLSGRLNDKLKDAKERLSSVLAHIEAYIDFPEEDIETSAKEGMIEALKEVYSLLEGLVLSYEEGKVYRDGIATVIVGRPNVGKSSLLNQLLKEKRAIVTSVPGTTRDVIEEYMNIMGVPLRLADTAGIRETDDLVETEGIRLARETLERADMALFVLDGGDRLTDDDWRLAALLSGKKAIVVVNKIDAERVLSDEDICKIKGGMPVVFISAMTGEGMHGLREAVFRAAVAGRGEPSEGIVLMRVRHRDSMQKAMAATVSGIKGIQENISCELTAVDLRAALSAIGEVVGETTPEDILDRIFSEFCIGK